MHLEGQLNQIQQIKEARRRDEPTRRRAAPTQTSSNVRQVRKPHRWDQPFGPRRIQAQDVRRILSYPIFKYIDPRPFPDDLALADIIANDGRIIRYSRGDIVFRQDDYGDSLFMILRGSVRGMTTAEGERSALQPKPPEKSSWLHSLSSLAGSDNRRGDSPDSSVRFDGLRKMVGDLLTAEKHVTRIEDVDGLIAKFPTFALSRNAIFGEYAALTRSPRGNTVFAEEDETFLLELRWSGVRDIRHWSDFFRDHIDELYHVRGLHTGLRASSLFDNVDANTLKIIAQHSRFETYGGFDWTHRYQREMADERGGEQIIDHEPIIAEQDHYLDDLLLIHSGFARLSEKVDNGEKTVGLMTKGDVFGLSEIAGCLQGEGDRKLRQSLRAIGYTDLIRIPAQIVEEYLLPTLAQNAKYKDVALGGHKPKAAGTPANNTGMRQSMLDFTVDNRFINGAKAMAIDTDRCVNCDDCVRACAATHDNIPRFVRQGKTHQNLMIANACMHCADPVCLIDCPTGAIHRDGDTGIVVIDEETCVGCATCANACPYGNIRMEEIRDSNGAFLVDEEGVPVVQATKCDFCAGQRGGPACQRACPHDALIRIDIRDVDPLAAWLERTQ